MAKANPPRALPTISDVYNVSLETKATVLEVKASLLDLREHVNDRNEAIEEHIGQLRSLIDGKLDDDELLTSIGFKLLNNRIIRWAVGALAVSAVSSVVVQHWQGPLADILRFVLHALQHI